LHAGKNVETLHEGYKQGRVATRVDVAANRSARLSGPQGPPSRRTDAIPDGMIASISETCIAPFALHAAITARLGFADAHASTAEDDHAPFATARDDQAQRAGCDEGI
jgi:hypothetical protein